MQAFARILHLSEGGGKLCASDGNVQHLHEELEVFQRWMGIRIDLSLPKALYQRMTEEKRNVVLQ